MSFPYAAESFGVTPTELLTDLARGKVPGSPGVMASPPSVTWRTDPVVAAATTDEPLLAGLAGAAIGTAPDGDGRQVFCIVGVGAGPHTRRLESPYWAGQGAAEVLLCAVPGGTPDEVMINALRLGLAAAGVHDAHIDMDPDGLVVRLKSVPASPSGAADDRLISLLEAMRSAVARLVADAGHPTAIRWSD